MAKSAANLPVPGPALVRLLDRLALIDAPRTSPIPAERLADWVDWTRAVALARSLDGPLPPPAEDVPAFDAAQDAACAELRAELVAAIGEDTAPLQRAIATAATAGPGAIDGQPFRDRHLALQRSMLGHTGRLRGRLRDMLAQRPDRARLAELDAFMEQVLSPREQGLFATLPGLLGGHFTRLQQAAVEAASPSDGDSAFSTSWLDAFRRDMQAIALDELDVRFQPIDGLLAALRTP